MQKHHWARHWAGALTAAFLVGSAACSVMLDHKSTQCQVDSDCAEFGSHPYCQQGVCVASGLGPADCFYGTPQKPEDFLNQCSTAQCLSFDNCARLGMCNEAGDEDGGLKTPQDAGAPSSGSSSSSAAGDAGAIALPMCMDPNSGRGQVMYLTGSSNFPPILAKLAPLLLATGYTPVYQVTSSCNGVNSVFSDTTSDHFISDPAPGSSGKTAAYFRSDGSSVPCSLGAAGVQVDIGESDVFASTCNPQAIPGGAIGEYLGPIQAMAFVVPGKSNQSAITAEAARQVFGAGGGTANPWINPALFFVRNASTGTQQMIGRAIGVPASSFWGIDRGTASNVDALIREIADPNLAQQAIGIISADYYDGDRANLKALAFKSADQECAYLPDSTQFRKDKRNVRDGHYTIWGPIHFFTQVAEGQPLSAGAQAFVNIVSVPNIPKALLDAFIGASLVPDCAMTVQRSAELGSLSAYAPPFQCGCYFEASPNVSGTAPDGCTACVTSADCTDPARPACNLGYCEVQ
ncbi:MAG TPA: hypothetical protein VGI39_19565 [Polyangiaceae bacterium]|jgi:hypothetical protein